MLVGALGPMCLLVHVGTLRPVWLPMQMGAVHNFGSSLTYGRMRFEGAGVNTGDGSTHVV